MFLVDPATATIVAANAAAASFYGYSRDELCGMPIATINQFEPSRIRELMDQAATRTANTFVAPHRIRSGEVRQVEVHSSPVEFDGRALLFSILHDVTDRLRAEAEKSLRGRLKDHADEFFSLKGLLSRSDTRVEYQGEDDFAQRAVTLGFSADQLACYTLAVEARDSLTEDQVGTVVSLVESYLNSWATSLLGRR